MKLAACIIVTLAGSASAQDLRVTIEPLPGQNRGRITAEYFGDIPTGATSIGSIWADTNFTIVTGDNPVTFTNWNAGYDSLIFGGPAIAGNGTQNVNFVGLQPGGGLGSPDPSNPLFVAEFDYVGGIGSPLDFFITGQNSALFTGNPAEPFGTILLYQDVNGNPGSLSIDVFNVYRFPSPTTLSVAPVALLATRRRR